MVGMAYAFYGISSIFGYQTELQWNEYLKLTLLFFILAEVNN